MFNKTLNNEGNEKKHLHYLFVPNQAQIFKISTTRTFKFIIKVHDNKTAKLLIITPMLLFKC